MRNNRMARRLMKQFVLLTAIPILITAVILANVGSGQIMWVADTMQKTNQLTVMEAGKEFRDLGGKAIWKSSANTQKASEQAMNEIGKRIVALQTQSLSSTSTSFSRLSSQAIEKALRQSLVIQKSALHTSQQQQEKLLMYATDAIQQSARKTVEKSILTLTRENLQSRALSLEEMMRDTAETAPAFLKFTAQMIDMSPDEEGDRKLKLEALVRRLPDFRTVSVLNTKGKEITRSSASQVFSATELGSFPNAPWFKAALHSHNYLARSRNSSETGAPEIRVAAPIEAYAGHVIGVITARYSLEDLWSNIRNSRIGKSGFVCVYDAAGKTILQPKPIPKNAMIAQALFPLLGWKVLVVAPRSEVMSPILEARAEIAHQEILTRRQAAMQSPKIVSSAARELRKGLDSVRKGAEAAMCIKAIQTLKQTKSSAIHQIQNRLSEIEYKIASQTAVDVAGSNLEMRSAATDSSEKMLAEMHPVAARALHSADNRFSLIALCLTALTCLVTAIAAKITAGRIVLPVTQLAQAATAIAQGDLNLRVVEDAPDEIGDLAAAFNTMAASLQQNREVIQQTEGQLVQSAKLASLGTLTAGVAHELNQPLAIIRGIAQQLVVEEGLPADLLPDLELIESQTGRMIKIIRHLRTFSRMGVVELSLVNVNNIIHDCFILVGAQLKSHDITVEMDLCENAPFILADPNELEQVFLNLITNARDALEGIENTTLSIKSEVSGDQFVVEFKDNGPGILESALSNIFDPFFTTKEPGKGTGLGLSISHGILQRHHGDISAHNDGGAVFTIMLPIPTPEETALAA